MNAHEIYLKAKEAHLKECTCLTDGYNENEHEEMICELAQDMLCDMS